MPEQCECAQLDWSNVDLTSEHHPECKRVESAVYMSGVHSFDSTPGKTVVDFSWRKNDSSRDDLLKAFEQDLAAQKLMLKPPAPIYYDPSMRIQMPERLIPGQIIPALQIPPRTIEELIAAMESLFEVGESTDHSQAVTSEPYKKYGIGFLLSLNAPVHRYVDLKQNSIKAMWNTALELRELASPAAVLYWRLKPNLQGVVDTTELGDYLRCHLTMRLLISDKPPLEK
ncbi:MAG: hypothetical protein WBV94_02745 [Blastocatellia bacterium]